MTNFNRNLLKSRYLSGQKAVLKFFQLFISQCKHDQLQVTAGYLSYVTIMSLVPLIVVMLSVMSAFPIFSELQNTIESFVYSNFVPTAGDIVQEHLAGFVANASKMSAIAISFLFLFALLLISVIDKSLNRIWQIDQKRRLITSFSMYWMVLTLGPVLMGSSIAATSYVVSLVSFSDENLVGITNQIFRLLPLLASMAGFLILYLVVPNKDVKIKHALLGALVAAILFEVAKKGFAFYVTQLPSYQAIYGTLATIPILFVWVYVSWFVVLVGAEFTRAMESYELKYPSSNNNESKDKERKPKQAQEKVREQTFNIDATHQDSQADNDELDANITELIDKKNR